MVKDNYDWFDGIFSDFDSTEEEGTTINISNTRTFGKFELCLLIVTTIFSIVDVGSDIYVAISYYQEELYYQFGAVLFFIIFSGVFVSIGSGIVYYFSSGEYFKEFKEFRKIPFYAKCFKVLSHLLLISSLYRAIEIIYFAYINKQIWDRKMEGVNGFYLFLGIFRLQEACIEAAPQLVLQMSVILQRSFEMNTESFFRIFSIIVSWITFSTILLTNYDNLRYEFKKKLNLTYSSKIIFTLSKIFITGARLLVMALFATVYPFWLLLGVCIHPIIIYIAIQIVKKKKMKKRKSALKKNELVHIPPLLTFILVAFIHNFDFFSFFKTKNKLWPYTVIYSIFFIENILMLLLWWFHSVEMILWLRLTFFCCVPLFMIFGVLLLIIYYVNFHPSRSKNTPTELNVIQKECKSLTSADLKTIS